jgi:hypothetical protein
MNVPGVTDEHSVSYCSPKFFPAHPIVTARPPLHLKLFSTPSPLDAASDWTYRLRPTHVGAAFGRPARVGAPRTPARAPEAAAAWSVPLRCPTQPPTSTATSTHICPTRRGAPPTPARAPESAAARSIPPLWHWHMPMSQPITVRLSWASSQALTLLPHPSTPASGHRRRPHPFSKLYQIWMKIDYDSVILDETWVC